MKAVLEREKAALASDASKLDQLQQDDEEEEMLELASLNLDDPDWVNHVSAKTLAKFTALIAGGALDTVFHQWVPWWTRDKLSPIIEILPSESAEEDAESDGEIDEASLGQPAPSPPICPNIPKVSDLTKITPSPLIAFNVAEVVFCYVYVKQLFNGDWDEENADEALEAVIALSSVLRENYVCKNAMESITRPVELAQTSREIFVSSSFSIASIRDTHMLISKGHLFLLAALSELQSTFISYNSKQAALPPSTRPKSSKKAPTLSQMQMKITFFVSWANEMAQAAIPELELGIRTVLSNYEQYEAKPVEKEESPATIATMAEPPKKTVKKPIIEELS